MSFRLEGLEQEGSLTQVSQILLWMDKSKPCVYSERFSSVLSVEKSPVFFHVQDAKLQDSTTCLSTEPTLVTTACAITQKKCVCVCLCVFPVQCLPPQHCLLVDLSLSSSGMPGLW